MRLQVFLLVGFCLTGCSASKTAEPTSPLPRANIVRGRINPKREAPPTAKPAKTPPGFKRREPHHSILGRWVDSEGVIYNFQPAEKVSWSRSIGSAEADFTGKYTVTEGVLVIVPKEATSPNSKLGKQLGTITRKHRVTQYTLEWQGNGTLVLSGATTKIVLAPVR